MFLGYKTPKTLSSKPLSSQSSSPKSSLVVESHGRESYSTAHQEQVKLSWLRPVLLKQKGPFSQYLHQRFDEQICWIKLEINQESFPSRQVKFGLNLDKKGLPLFSSIKSIQCAAADQTEKMKLQDE